MPNAGSNYAARGAESVGADRHCRLGRPTRTDFPHASRAWERRLVYTG